MQKLASQDKEECGLKKLKDLFPSPLLVGMQASATTLEKNLEAS
jgi:hypothetical protein